MIEQDMHRLGRYRIQRALDIAGKGEPDGISGALLLAMCSRETNGRNIVGFDGHDRGALQISDRYHAMWLREQLGCPSGSWKPDLRRNALEPGYVPQWTPSCWKAISILRSHRVYARNRGVPAHLLTRFAVAAYNCGAYRALLSWRETGGFDKYTTHGNYSTDVCDQRLPVVRVYLDAKGF